MRNALLLQGPVGPFFWRFAKDLETHGFTAYKINFNGGDAFCYRGRNTIPYRGGLSEFAGFFETRLQQLAIERIYIFGDARPHHEIAIDVARQLGVRVFVFEEGYIRPDHVTLEEDGVNGRSNMPRDPDFYLSQNFPLQPRPLHVSHSFLFITWRAIVYYLACFVAWWRYPRYRHHRPLNIFTEGAKWIRSGFRKVYYRWTERHVLDLLANRYTKRYFLVPLQLYCDGQIRYSRYNLVGDFIKEVVDSFDRYAPRDKLLIIKHHPLDRAYNDYSRCIRQLTDQYKLHGRLFYVHDLRIPTLLDHACGTVVINSTVGLSSILHRTPVIALDDAIYNFAGMTYQGELHRFWKDPTEVNERLNQSFRAYLASTNQINGSFYRTLTNNGYASGLNYPKDFWDRHVAES